MIIIQHPEKTEKIRSGELAHLAVFLRFFGAAKTRSVSGRPQSGMLCIPDLGADLLSHHILIQPAKHFGLGVLAYYHIVICQFYLTDQANNLIMAVLY